MQASQTPLSPDDAPVGTGLRTAAARQGDEVPSVRILRGFPEEQREVVAKLFWDAFSGKLGRIMRPEAKALAFLYRTLSAKAALAAVDDTGAVVGVVGIKTDEGGLVLSGFDDMAVIYGWLGAAWRAPLLDLTERRHELGKLLLDGIFVSEHARGQGIGTQLLEAAVAEARARGCTHMRLDVVDNNARARALYERFGFVAVAEERTGIFRPIFGFKASTQMLFRVSP